MSRRLHLALLGAGAALILLGLWLWRSQGAMIWLGAVLDYCL